jgi:predicted SnoaL-like aldol condensation-catalyzing enzyme
MADKATQNKAVIVEALTKAYLKRDFSAPEQWFAPGYIQHNPYIPATRAGLRTFCGTWMVGAAPGQLSAPRRRPVVEAATR